MGARPSSHAQQKVSLCVITFVLIFAGQAVPSTGPLAPTAEHVPRGTMVTTVIMGIVVAHYCCSVEAASADPGWGGTSAPSSDQGLELAEGRQRGGAGAAG